MTSILVVSASSVLSLSLGHVDHCFVLVLLQLKKDSILSLLPSYKGKSVLELGAGIGRFTGELAKEAGHVLALDFIGIVIKKVNFSYLKISCLSAGMC